MNNFLFCVILPSNEAVRILVKLYENGGIYDIEIPKFNIHFKKIKCNLAGTHQIDNSALAILVVASLFKNEDRKLEEEKIRAGLNSIRWLRELSLVVDFFVICKSKSSRAAETVMLSKEVKKYKIGYILESDIKLALAKAKELAGKDDLICVTGSLYTIGELLRREGG